MNRAERRKKQKAKKRMMSDTYSVTGKTINDICSQITDMAWRDASHMVIPIALVASVRSLKRLHKWGKKRLGDFAEEAIDIYQEINAGKVTFEELSDELYESTGVRMARKENGFDVERKGK